MRLQKLIFGTAGLFSKWMDGRERAEKIGRIVKRASTRYTHFSKSASLLDYDFDSEDSKDSDSSIDPECDDGYWNSIVHIERAGTLYGYPLAASP